MYTLSLIIGLLLLPATYELNINFGKSKSGGSWMVVNDGVMGGLSNSKAILLENSMLFDGLISLDNNGGFASVRSGLTSIDLSKTERVTIRYRSKGQNVGLRLLKSDRFYLPYFKTYLSPTSGEWRTVVFSIDDFEEYRLENKTGREITKDELDNIIRIGLIVSNKEEGPFLVEVDYIRFN